MPELTNPATGQTATFTDDQARWYRNRGWTDPTESETVAQVKERVGDDLALADAALAAEHNRAGGPRTTLVDYLESIIESD